MVCIRCLHGPAAHLVHEDLPKVKLLVVLPAAVGDVHPLTLLCLRVISRDLPTHAMLSRTQRLANGRYMHAAARKHRTSVPSKCMPQLSARSSSMPPHLAVALQLGGALRGALLQDEGLGHQHDGHCHNGRQHKQHLQQLGWVSMQSSLAQAGHKVQHDATASVAAMMHAATACSQLRWPKDSLSCAQLAAASAAHQAAALQDPPIAVCAVHAWAHLQGTLPSEHLVLRAAVVATAVPALEPIGAGGQEHVDHGVVQVGGGAGDPLAHDEEGEVAEQAVEEHHLGDELAVCGQRVPEVALVQEAEQDAHVHLDDPCSSMHAWQR